MTTKLLKYRGDDGVWLGAHSVAADLATSYRIIELRVEVEALTAQRDRARRDERRWAIRALFYQVAWLLFFVLWILE